jgi:hypothetical protein
MEAFDTPEEKLFARVVEQWPPRPLPILKAFMAFAVYTLAVAGLCLAVWMVAG